MHSPRASSRSATTSPNHHDLSFPTPLHTPQWSSPVAFHSSPWYTISGEDGGGQVSHHHATSPPPHGLLSSIVKRCGRILSIAVSDSGLVYAGTESKTVRIWRLPDFTEFSQLKSGSPVVDALLLSSDQGLIFTAHSDRKIRVWNSNPIHTRKGTLPSRKDRLIGAWVTHPLAIFGGAAGSSRSRYASSSSAGNKLKHSGAITSLAYDPSLNVLYSASSDYSIKVWNVGEMKCAETIYAHDGCVNAVAIAPDGLVFSGSDDTLVKVWKRSQGGRNCSYHALLFYLQQHRSPVKAMAISASNPHQYVLYAGCEDGCLHYWKKGRSAAMRHMNYLGFLRGHSGAVLCLDVVERVVVSGSADGSVRVWRREEGEGVVVVHQCMAVFAGHMGPVKGVVARLDADTGGFLVFSGSLDGSVKHWWVGNGNSSSTRSGFGGDDRDEGDEGGSLSDYYEISSPMRSLRS